MDVTVIIPTYKRLDYLQQAIKSVLQQTYQQFTCLIVNDYPGDRQAIESLLAEINDERLRSIDSNSQGGNAARNKGIRAAQGDLIAFLDDDDLWRADKLAKHVRQHQNNPQVGLVYSGLIQKWDKDLLPSKMALPSLPSEPVTTAMMGGTFCPYTTSSVTVLRQCFEQCGLFDENLVSFQDWDMWYRIAQKYQFGYVNEPLVEFRQHLGDRTSKTLARRVEGLEQLIDKWGDRLERPEQFRHKYLKESYITLTSNLILQKRKLEAIGYWFTLFKFIDRPFDFLQQIKLILMILFDVDTYGAILNFYRMNFNFNKNKI